MSLATRSPLAWMPQRPLGRDLHWWFVRPASTAPRSVGCGCAVAARRWSTTVATATRSPPARRTGGRCSRLGTPREWGRWPDGTEEPVDAMMFATGYRPDLGYLAGTAALTPRRPAASRGPLTDGARVSATSASNTSAASRPTPCTASAATPGTSSAGSPRRRIAIGSNARPSRARSRPPAAAPAHEHRPLVADRAPEFAHTRSAGTRVPIRHAASPQPRGCRGHRAGGDVAHPPPPRRARALPTGWRHGCTASPPTRSLRGHYRRPARRELPSAEVPEPHHSSRRRRQRSPTTFDVAPRPA